MTGAAGMCGVARSLLCLLLTPTCPAPPWPQLQEAEKPLILQKGQGTAVATGVISIVLGVAYLALVFLMDWRGGACVTSDPSFILATGHICTSAMTLMTPPVRTGSPMSLITNGVRVCTN